MFIASGGHLRYIYYSATLFGTTGGGGYIIIYITTVDRFTFSSGNDENFKNAMSYFIII